MYLYKHSVWFSCCPVCTYCSSIGSGSIQLYYLLTQSLTRLLTSSAGQDGPSKSLAGVVGGSAQPRPTHPPAPPARVTLVTTGCFFPCGRMTTCHRAACASTTRPRALSTPSRSSSHRHLRAAKHGRKWWTTHNSAASVRKPVAREKEMTGGVRVSFVFLLTHTALHYCCRMNFSL